MQIRIDNLLVDGMLRLKVERESDSLAGNSPPRIHKVSESELGRTPNPKIQRGSLNVTPKTGGGRVSPLVPLLWASLAQFFDPSLSSDVSRKL